MSAPLAGKFQDHYAVLGVDPKATSETIQKAYVALARKYHPSNGETGDAELFEAANTAYETLSDPTLRSMFDKVKGVGQEDTGPKFSGGEFFEALGRESVRRAAILCVLYDRRLTKPTTPSLSMRHLELIVEATSSELSSALWYLKQRGLAASDDKSSLQITVDGMDWVENNKPLPQDVLAFIKPTALAKSQAQPEQVPNPPSQPEMVQTQPVPPPAVVSVTVQTEPENRPIPTQPIQTQPIQTQEVQAPQIEPAPAPVPTAKAPESVLSTLHRALARNENSTACSVYD